MIRLTSSLMSCLVSISQHGHHPLVPCKNAPASVVTDPNAAACARNGRAHAAAHHVLHAPAAPCAESQRCAYSTAGSQLGCGFHGCTPVRAQGHSNISPSGFALPALCLQMKDSNAAYPSPGARMTCAKLSDCACSHCKLPHTIQLLALTRMRSGSWAAEGPPHPTISICRAATASLWFRPAACMHR